MRLQVQDSPLPNGWPVRRNTMDGRQAGVAVNPEPLAQTDHRHYIYEKYSLSLLKHRFGIMP